MVQLYAYLLFVFVGTTRVNIHLVPIKSVFEWKKANITHIGPFQRFSFSLLNFSVSFNKNTLNFPPDQGQMENIYKFTHTHVHSLFWEKIGIATKMKNSFNGKSRTIEITTALTELFLFFFFFAFYIISLDWNW